MSRGDTAFAIAGEYHCERSLQCCSAREESPSTCKSRQDRQSFSCFGQLKKPTAKLEFDPSFLTSTRGHQYLVLAKGMVFVAFESTRCIRICVMIILSLFCLVAAIAADGYIDTKYDPTKPLEDPSLLWGTYRPQIYFGIRPAIPDSILSGLLWFSPQRHDSFMKARHDCDEGDKLKGYGWKYHDGRSFAIQEIRDIENNYLLETSWVKTGQEGSTASKGSPGSWAVRIKGTVIDNGEIESLVLD